MQTHKQGGTTEAGKRIRRLKPEVAAKMAARRHEAELQQLYSRPVEQLSPKDIALMKAMFFQRQ